MKTIETELAERINDVAKWKWRFIIAMGCYVLTFFQLNNYRWNLPKELQARTAFTDPTNYSKQDEIHPQFQAARSPSLLATNWADILEQDGTWTYKNFQERRRAATNALPLQRWDKML